jgi:hypothetical protein
MAFFNPFDVITAGAGALPGTGVSDAAIRAGKVSAPAGSLAALGGGQAGPNGPGGAMAWMQPSPQPVPGMPPQQTPTMNPDILKRFMDPSFDPRMEPGFQDPRMPGAGIDPSTGQPMTQQDYDNTLKRYNELLPESQKYFRDFGPPDPNDPTRNEMNVLGQRLEAWQAMPGNAPVYQTMGGGEGPGGFTGQNQDPNFGQLSTVGAGPYGNRGSGQPISQPMGGYQAPGMATWTPAAGVPNG